jgi:hypothetical protein
MGSASDLRFLARSVVKPKPGSREFEKLSLTGFDFRSLKQSIFHKRVLLFDTSSGSKEEEEEEGFDFELCSKKLKETLAITLDKCYPFAGPSSVSLLLLLLLPLPVLVAVYGENNL